MAKLGKAARKAERRRLRNRSLRTALRTSVKKAEGLIAQKDPQAEAAVLQASRALDKAVSKGVIHSNTAARHKSRLMAKLRALSSPPAPPGRAPSTPSPPP